MPRYSFTLKWDHERSDVAWTYLPTDDTARTYARILLRNARQENAHRHSPDLRMVVSNDDGREIASLRVFEK